MWGRTTAHRSADQAKVGKSAAALRCLSSIGAYVRVHTRICRHAHIPVRAPFGQG